MVNKEQGFSPDQGSVEPVVGEEPEDLESAKIALAAENEKVEKYLANWQRAEADLINYKRRSEQERCNVADFANASLISGLLPVLDDLERALESQPNNVDESTFVSGIRLIYQKSKAVLEGWGLSEVEAEGKDFDPNIHEAVMCVAGEEGKVVEVLQKGYKLHDRLLRPTMVKVGKE